MKSEKKYLLGMTIEQLQDIVVAEGLPRFTAKQIADWIYKKRVDSIDKMSNLSIKNREKLAASYEVGINPPREEIRSVDGTIKYLYATKENCFVETVYIPDGERATICISSQVGCKMNCLFCMTGKQSYTANLTTNEILNQIYALPNFENLTNLVFMGMGEPCDNISNLLQAVKILTSDYGTAISPHRITISTVGLRKGLKTLLEAGDYHIAISLHHPIPEKRSELMPAEKGYSIKEVVELLRDYDFSHQRRLTFEYIVFKGINDTLYHGRELLKLLEGLDCRINLIRYHSIPSVPLEGVADETMKKFRDYLTKNGIFTTIRASRGEDIFAACGMLSTLKQSNK